MDPIYKDFLFIDFGESTKAWLEILAGLPRGEIYWNIDFEISVLLCYMTWGNPPQRQASCTFSQLQSMDFMFSLWKQTKGFNAEFTGRNLHYKYQQCVMKALVV